MWNQHNCRRDVLQYYSNRISSKNALVINYARLHQSSLLVFLSPKSFYCTGGYGLEYFIITKANNKLPILHSCRWRCSLHKLKVGALLALIFRSLGIIFMALDIPKKAWRQEISERPSRARRAMGVYWWLLGCKDLPKDTALANYVWGSYYG